MGSTRASEPGLSSRTTAPRPNRRATQKLALSPSTPPSTLTAKPGQNPISTPAVKRKGELLIGVKTTVAHLSRT
jgi:hypothetical protein